MKQAVLVLAAGAALALGSITMANAQDIHVGPGGVDVGPHHHYYDYGGNCRTVIEHRTNERGDSVTVRRHVCD